MVKDIQVYITNHSIKILIYITRSTESGLYLISSKLERGNKIFYDSYFYRLFRTSIRSVTSELINEQQKT